MGTPQIAEIDGGAALREYAPALEHGYLHGALLCIHQYIPAGPGIALPSDAFYFHLRWQHFILPWLRARGIRYPKYLVTEVGCDLGGGLAASRGYTGYFAGYKVERPYGFGSDEVGVRAYIAALRIIADVYAADPDCEGMTIFCVGGNGDIKWESFRVDDILEQLSAEAFPAPGQNAPPTTPSIEIMRLDIPYISQEFPDAQTNFALGECLQAGVLAVARSTGRRETLNDVARLTGLPRGYKASDIVKHGVNLAPKLGLRMIWAGWMTAQDLRNEIRAQRSVLVRGWYPFLPKQFYKKYNNYHFFTIHGFEGSTFFYDDPGWESRAEGENIPIAEGDLMRSLNRRSGGGAPAQCLLLRSHTLPVWRMS